MKCPKCGFVSYAGLDQCKKCNYPFVKSTAKGSSTFLTSLFPEEVRAPTSTTAEPLLAPMDNSTRSKPELPTQPQSILDSEPEPNATRQFISPGVLSTKENSGSDESSANWREELSERVVTFRKRRGQLPAASDSGVNLELEFADLGKHEDVESLFHSEETTGVESSRFDLDIGNPKISQDSVGEMDGETRRALDLGEEGHFDPAQEDADDMSLGTPIVKNPPMEILVGGPTLAERENLSDAQQLFYAPVNRRLLAGLTDALILFVGAALFAGIFWYSMTRFCDHNSLIPFDMAVLGLAAIIVIFSYFAIFTALTSATPGLLLMGCEIRNLQGDHPTLSESLWRAFGILVSMSALMVGFIWAYVDSDNLTWHDRMSDTIITEAQTAGGLMA